MNKACQPEIRGPTRRLTRLWAALVALSILAAVSAACNGGGDGEGSATSTACQALAGLNSYRYVSNLTLEIPEGTVPFVEGQPTPASTITRDVTSSYFEYNTDASFMAPDRFDALITTGTGSFNLIVIGDKRWITLGQRWDEVTAEYTVAYNPLDICTAIFPELKFDETQGEKETINKVSAGHYAFPAIPSGQAMATIFGAESDMAILFQTMNVEVSLAEDDGWPVRMDIQGSGLYANRKELRAHIRIELRDINDNEIKIEPPI